MDPNALKNIHVLIVEDDEDDWLITKKIFSKIKESPFVIEWARSYDEAVAHIDSDSHDVYLIDYRLGEHTGTDLLQYAHPETRRQPFILMTGVSDHDLEWRSLKLAAADYLVKGSFDAILLSRTLFYALQRKYIEQQRIDQLMELNRAKEDFISIASHQLRTPATGVKQFLGMVIEGFVGDVPEAQMPLLRQAYESNERQLRIINDLLKVAQVDSGKIRLRFNEMNINELVKEVVDEQLQRFRDRGQTLTIQPVSGAPVMYFDADTMRMVLENLIDNAGKYSKPGTTVSVEIIEDDMSMHISVKDQGVGIEPEDIPNLFQKFARFDNELSTEVGGTGLGLYWAKRIVDMHNGSIDYAPREGGGSAFTICLPKLQRKT